MATSSQAITQPAPGANVRLPRRRYAAIPLPVRAAIMRSRVALSERSELSAATVLDVISSNRGREARSTAASFPAQGPWTCA